MTPAPMTPSRFGTASNSSAFQESMMDLPSCGTAFKRMGIEPLASTTCLRLQSLFRVPSGAVTSHVVAGQQAPVAVNADVTPAALNSEAMPPVMVLTIVGAALLHRRQIELDVAES